MRARSRLTSKQSKRFIERKQTRRVVEAILILVCFTVVMFSVSKLTHIGVLSIVSVQIFGADADITKSLEAAAYKSIDGNYLGIFSKSNIFLYPKRSITDSIKKTSLRIDSVDISRGSGGKLTVSVKEKTPASVICANLPDFSFTEDTCYFADSTGLIYKSAPTFSVSIYKKYFIPAITDMATTSNAVIGLYATSTPEFKNLQTFYDNILASGIDAEAILSKDNGEYELYVRNPLINVQSEDLTKSADDNLAVVYVNNGRSFDEQALNLISFWKTMIDTAKNKGQTLEYEYIDVRYGSNVFYRLIK